MTIELKLDEGSDPVDMQAAANDAAKSKTVREIGDEMPDGTIYAGYSPETYKPMFAMPKDESGTYTFNQAAKHAKKIGGGFRVPTIRELDVLFDNRNKGKLKGTFNEIDSSPAGWYWSSKRDYWPKAWAQSFYGAEQYRYYQYDALCLRLVR